MSKLVRGMGHDNQLQMRLSAYVLAYRLSQVVAAANARLAGMSDQRYSLEHVGRRGAGEARGGLSLADHDEPCFWEALGYHMYGDPWQEQRYWGD